MGDDIRRNQSLFPIGIVTKLTELTPRQIRYYEQQGLVSPARTEGKQRLFSLHDVEQLLEIKSLMDKGINVQGVKEMLTTVKLSEKELSEKELRKRLKQQLTHPTRPGQIHLTQGELSRFFK